MQRIIVSILAIIAVGAAVFAYLNFGPQEQAPSQGVTAAGSSTAPQDEGVAPLPMYEGPDDAIVFTRLEIDTATDAPEACLVFSEDLSAEDDVDYANYLAIEPVTKPSLRVDGPLLCLGGLAFNQTYQVTVREGMPAASGNQTPFDELVPVELRDRPAAAAFGGGVILPRESGGGIPVTTVNIDTLSVRVLRVGERLVARLREGLIDANELYSYEASQVGEDQGAVIWEGEMDIASVPNQSVRTVFPLRDILVGQDAGVFLILAEDARPSTGSDQYWRGTAAQWILETDIGLTTFQGENGLRVFARRLSTADLLQGLTVSLIARNNEVLGRYETGANGEVHFEGPLLQGTGGNAPVAVMAHGPDEDFAFLDLRRAAFDLSDRGVSGRAQSGPIDAFLHTDRGIYRPGETVQLVTHVRDRRANALTDLPLTIVVTRPDGVEFLRETINDTAAGVVHFPIELSQTAPRGVWRAQTYVDTSAAPVGRIQFDVQDFVPERLEINAEAAQAVLRPGDDITIDVSARFLYDAPAAQMGGEAELRLSRDPVPFPEYSDFAFGRVEERIDAQLWPLSLASTDANGETQATGSLNNLPDLSTPLRGTARIAIYEPGGRSTQTLVDMQIRSRDAYLGIQSNFEGRYVPTGEQAAFNIISLDGEGRRTALEGVRWEIVREVTNYQWYEVDGQWRYERVVRDRAVNAGVLNTGEDQLASVTDTLPWGTYRLVAFDPAGVAEGSVRFYVGWWGASAEDRPDQLIVVADQSDQSVGNQVDVSIQPAIAGPASIVVATDHVVETRHVMVPAEGLTVSLDVTEEWGAGAYVLVTHYRPLSEGDARSPVRSVGLTWVEVDHQDRLLDVQLDVPDNVTPQQSIEIPFTVAGAAGEDVFLTVAAVDEGILQLTRFSSPDPVGHYFGKRRLGLDMRDDYGRLIQDTSGQFGPIRTGGDSAFGGAGLTVVPTRTVALFSGLVQAGEDGRGSITLDIPDFNGELRLMAVASSATRVGQSEAALTIRDDAVAELSLPRFLAPDDRAQATLSVHNVAGAAGTYRVEFSSTDQLNLSGETSYEFELEEGARAETQVMLTAQSLGVADISMQISGPQGFARERGWQIEVRPAQLPGASEVVSVLDPGMTSNLPSDVVTGIVPDTALVSVSVSSTRGFDTAGLLSALDRYPFGCLEQTVSRAYPLLHFRDLAGAIGMETGDAYQVRLQNAVNRVLDMQRSNGAFGMWGAQSTEADTWLSLYAFEFLAEAKGESYVVPNDALARATEWSRQIASQSWREPELRAYAFYLLAREGQLVPGDVRYFHDTARPQMTDIMGLAHLAGALDGIGDRARASTTYDQILRLVDGADAATYEAQRYGSLLRDVAGLIAVASEANRMAVLPALLDRVDALAPRLHYTTTQERAWLLLAADRLSSNMADVDVAFEGTSRVQGDDPVAATPSLAEIAGGVSWSSQSTSPLWQTTTVQGVPEGPLSAQADGLLVSRGHFSLDGAPVDLGAVRQNDQIVVVIRGRMNDNYFREMAVMDLLPAGFEIEAVASAGMFNWLPDLSYTRMAEARDDRFVAAFDIGNRYRPEAPDSQGNPILPRFAVAYVARAITPGVFVQPPSYVEDMYQPRVAARTEMGTVTITGAD